MARRRLLLLVFLGGIGDGVGIKRRWGGQKKGRMGNQTSRTASYVRSLCTQVLLGVAKNSSHPNSETSFPTCTPAFPHSPDATSSSVYAARRALPRMPLDVRYRVCCSTRATAYAARRMLPRMPLNARYCVCRSTCVTTYPARRASPQRAHAWVVTQGFHKYGTVVLCACSAHLLRFEIGIERTAREGVFITNEDIMSQVH